MARHRFGLTPADWGFTVAIDGLTPQLAAGATFTAWNQLTSGTQYTDLALDSAGLEPITFITASDGSDGYLSGTVEFFWGPDGIRELYIDGGAGGRLLLTANDIGATLDDYETRIEALENQVANLLQLAAITPYVNIEVAGVYPDRPAIAGSNVVFWIGDDTPTGGGAPGMATGDLDFDTAP